ncbi:putative quinol monooxygenase [Pseudoponticoccus marisrubri]|uniref:Antibiotic biosynthesis monooxygenase n=1 Tax=Pseudoponticoccus marisrubri TaxID=1685382 RepID=A0A0W7WHD4_9RHOB|nr:putative quinol monooxygenase [Pseudoponticoccus marisrubri]KUF10048.1 antibiotic biosynthesis monooxygenase [Pseudoponticoccus marisrubri]
MFAVTVTLTLHPGTRAAFLPLMTENARRSLADEPGCRQFDICTDGAEQVFLYEIYDSAAAFDAHLDSAHFKAFDAQVAGMIAEKTVTTWDEVIR